MIPVAMRMADNFERRRRGHDPQSAALLGLAFACKRYDPQRGLSFRRFAKMCISNTLSNDRRQVALVSQNDRRPASELAPWELYPVHFSYVEDDEIGDHGRWESDALENLELRGLIDSLDATDRAIIDLSLTGLKQSEIGGLIGRSQMFVSRHYARAIASMRASVLEASLP